MNRSTPSRLASTIRHRVRHYSARVPPVHSHLLVLFLILVFGAWFFTLGHAQSAPTPAGNWLMDEGSGTTLADSSGHGLTGTIVNGTWQTGASCHSGSCLNFDGTGYVNIQDNTTLLDNNFTLATWINISQTPAYVGAFAVGTYENSSLASAGIVLYQWSQQWSIHCVAGNSDQNEAIAIMPQGWANTWHHVACTRTTDGTIKLYFDGALAATKTGAVAGSLNLTQFPYGNNYLRLAGTNVQGDVGVTGSMDQVHVYSTALSVAQVNELYTNGTLGGADTTAPTPPTTITPSGITPASFHLAWSGATDNVGVTGYYVDVSTSSNFSSFVSGWNNANVGNVTQTDVNALAASTTYYVRIRSYDAASNTSTNSSTANATTTAASDTTPPSAPTTPSASALSKSVIRFTWTAATDNVGVTSYRVDASTSSSFTSFVTDWNNVDVGNVTTIDVNGLLSGTQYFFRVRARDAAGNTSANSSTASATTNPMNPAFSLCGNGVVEAGETCEGSGSQACTTNGYSGTQSCNASTCQWNTCTTTQSCGDGTCNGAETNATCPADCGVPTVTCGNNQLDAGEVCDPPGTHSCTTNAGYSGTFSCSSDCSSQGTCTSNSYCGDGTCSGLENSSNCANDCPVTGPTCGNNTCESGEYCYSCPGDCGSCGNTPSNNGNGSPGNGSGNQNSAAGSFPSSTAPPSNPPVTPASVIVTDTVHFVKDAASGASTPILNTSNWIVETSGAAVGGVFTLFCLLAGFVSDFLFRHLRFNQNTQDNRWKYNAVRVAVAGVFFFLPLITGFTAGFSTGIIFAVLQTVSFWGFSKVMERIAAKAGNFAVPTIEQVK